MKLHPEMVHSLQTQLYNIFRDSKRLGLDSFKFIKAFITSKEFKGDMLNYVSAPYWDYGSMYVVRDFTDKYHVNRGKTLSDLELNYMARNILDFIYNHQVSPEKIADNISRILQYCDYVDYHSPKEIIEKCQLKKV